MTLTRRAFVKAVAVVPVASYTHSPFGKDTGAPEQGALCPLRSFDFHDVRLLPGPLATQYRQTRDFYYGISNDDILKGFREYAGMPAPGKELGGWCRRDASEVFGQWLSGMSRMYRTTNDKKMKDKAEFLMREWGKTIGAGSGSGIAYYTERKGHYLYDKNVCGLTDMAVFADLPEAWKLLDRITDWAEKNLSRQRKVATSEQRQANFDGHSMEWYTLSENLYRAWLASGNPRYGDFADLWRYDEYWSRFYTNAFPANVCHVHAYSHINSFSSAAMSYIARGNVQYFNAAKNAFTYLVERQSYATGSYGPAETLVAPGELGHSLELRSDSAECPCGAWAGFKLSQYLTMLTGQAFYGDLAELLLYNVMRAALPMSGNGKTFYYGDYRVGGGKKTYRWDTWPCCSGTFIQNVASYSNFAYYYSGSNLYVNLFIPSEVAWNSLLVQQETHYPESEEIAFTIRGTSPSEAMIHFRIPLWCNGASLKVNGASLDTNCKPGSWAALSRVWKDGDTVTLRLPMSLRAVPIDEQHPNRIALIYGPVVLAQDARVHQQFVPNCAPGVLETQFARGDRPLEFIAGNQGRNRFRPFYAFEEVVPYWMYFDV